MFYKKNFLLALVFVFCGSSRAEILRQYDLGLGAGLKSNKVAAQFVFDYNWILSPISKVGINTTLRSWGASENHIVYGLTLSHRVWEFQNGLYFRYGLLMRATLLDTRSGYAQNHETDLGFRLVTDKSLFYGLSYSLSSLHFFEQQEGRQNVWSAYLGYTWN